MHSTIPSRSVRILVALSIVARLPEAMLGIGLLVHTQHLTGSFAAAGLVTAAYGLAVGAGGPVLGRLIDRRGHTRVLVASASLQAALLGAVVIAPDRWPVVVSVVLAIGIGLATPPVGAALRARLPALLLEPGALNRAYSLETSMNELTWVGGPPLVLGLGTIWSTGGALLTVGLVLLVSTIAFAAQPISRARAPVTPPERRVGSLSSPAMRTLIVALLALGVLLGADEVAITAAAKTLSGTTGSAAPLLALWAAGSFAGGLLVGRFGGRLAGAGGLTLGLVALTVGHLALIPAAGSLGTLAAVLLVAGTAIAPTEVATYAMVDAAAPVGTVTEAFSWLITAGAVGGAAGSAAAGLLTARMGPAAALALGGGACAVAALLTALRAQTLAPTPVAPADPALPPPALPAVAGT